MTMRIVARLGALLLTMGWITGCEGVDEPLNPAGVTLLTLDDTLRVQEVVDLRLENNSERQVQFQLSDAALQVRYGNNWHKVPKPQTSICTLEGPTVVDPGKVAAVTYAVGGIAGSHRLIVDILWGGSSAVLASEPFYIRAD